MTKKLSKEIMKRSRLRNKYNKFNTEYYKKAYKKSRKYCLSLLRKEKRCFFNNMCPKDVEDNRKFWKTAKPFFSDKVSSKNNISLIEGQKMILKDAEIAETFNEYFINIVPLLGIQKNNDLLSYNCHITDPINKILEEYKEHPSITAIENNKSFKSSSSKITFYL